MTTNPMPTEDRQALALDELRRAIERQTARIEAIAERLERLIGREQLDPPPKLSREQKMAMALGIAAKDPELNNSQVARQCHLTPGALAKNKEFQALRKAQALGRGRRVTGGHRDTNGALVAISHD